MKKSLIYDEWFIQNKVPLIDFMIFNVTWWVLEYSENIAEIIQEKWFGVDIYYSEESIQKQFKYALSKNISYWIFAWWDEIKIIV